MPKSEYDDFPISMSWKGEDLVNFRGAQMALDEMKVYAGDKLLGLDLSHHWLCDVGVARLLQGMVELKDAGQDIALQRLDLSANRLTNASCLVICQHLLDPTSVISTLETLDLR